MFSGGSILGGARDLTRSLNAWVGLVRSSSMILAMRLNWSGASRRNSGYVNLDT